MILSENKIKRPKNKKFINLKRKIIKVQILRNQNEKENKNLYREVCEEKFSLFSLPSVISKIYIKFLLVNTQRS